MSQVPEQIAGLSPGEKRALVARALRERAAAARPSDVFAHRLFEVQAAKTPGALAVTCGGRELTYAALNARANRLAHHLRALGVGPDVLVGLFVERSPEMVVGLLGVLKAGGAYVPLDPAYPAGRLAFMLDDSRAPVLLTQESLRGRLPDRPGAVVRLDGDEPWPSAATDADADADAETDPAGLATADNLAYLIYTSGSTGRPKGAMVTHRGLANYLGWALRAYAVADGSGAPVHSSFSFDLTVTSLLAPLAAGRRVDLLAEGPGVEALAEALRAGADYSLVKLTPAHLQLLGETLKPREAPGGARVFVIGGEQLTAGQVSFWLENAPATRLVNEYGPTETVVGCCIYEVPPGEPPPRTIPIGRPIAGTRLHVLDARMQAAPVGVVGELFIGGLGLARGYLGRPGLTAEKFVPDPFGKGPGGRLYRTGDLVRGRLDGNLEFLGRADEQIKVRGYRIEPGEIEAALIRHPSLSRAAVVARQDAPGDARLVAYVVAPAGGPVPGDDEFREFLKTSLPEYMVPSAFVALAELPLTPNGKVDRGALPPPGPARPRSADRYTPPRGPVEEAVVGLWAEMLGRERVGVHDNFFDLGGHSLVATRVLSRVRDTFAVEPSLREFLDLPTVAGLSRLIDRALTAGAGLVVPPIRPAGRDGPIPASFAQQRLWFLDQLGPGAATYNVPAAVRLVGALDVDALRRALNEVVRRHEVLRTTFDSVGGVPRQVIAPNLDVPLPLTDLTGLPESEARRTLDEEARRPFDLARGPLLRAGLLRLGDREHVVHVTTHHIASDGWSMGVLIREVAALYESFHRGEPSPLPDLPVQYADFAAWQRDWLRGETLATQVDYWRDRLDGLHALELPTDRPRPSAPSGRGDERSVVLPRALLADLQATGRQEGATLFMTLLAAFQVLLHRYSAQDDVAVGTPIAGRTRSEVEDLIGFFVNTMVLRVDLSGDPSFRALLRRVRPVALGAYAHQDLPFDQLVGVLQPDREPGRTPLFQVMFALQNTPIAALKSSDLELVPLETRSGTAKYDLTLLMAEGEQGLHATMEYSADLFDPATIDGMLGHLQVLLEAIRADPDAPISDLPMLTLAERRQLLDQWNDAETALPPSLVDVSDEEVDALLSRLAAEGNAVEGSS